MIPASSPDMPPPLNNSFGLKLLFVVTQLTTGGGAEEQVFQLAHSQRDRGWNVEIVSMLRPEDMPAPPGPKIRIHTLDMLRGVPDVRAVARLARIVQRFRPDVVHSHMTHANILARLARPFCEMPVLISTLHGTQMNAADGGSTKWRELAHRFTDRWADLTTAVSIAATYAYIENRSVPAHKALVVPNGIDTERFKPDPAARIHSRRRLGVEDRTVWLAVGRFEKAKAYPTMIEAFARFVAADTRDNILLLCGDGSLLNAAQEQVRALGLEKRVRFLGYRADVPEIMNAADCYLMSSDTEGLPLVLLQASAAGLPIIATAVGGNPEIVVNGTTGYLSPAGSPKALAAAMLDLSRLSDEDRIRMGRLGRARTVANYDMVNIAHRWSTLYGRLLPRTEYYEEQAGAAPAVSGLPQADPVEAGDRGPA